MPSHELTATCWHRHRRPLTGPPVWNGRPLIPVPFRLVVRQVRTEEGYVTDPVAIRQLEVLRGLLENADALVIATDAGREGELVSRYLLDYLGYRKPALRLWISSLTEKAILNGFKNLREDGDFDNR